jgi:hypothetical protein
MRKTIDERITVTGSPTALLALFHHEPDEWLPEPVVPVPEAGNEWQTVAWAGSLGVFVGCTAGKPYPRQGGIWRMLRWTALSPQGLAAPLMWAAPSFGGHLGLLPKGDSAVTFVLRGEFIPPGGLLGGLAAACLGRIARTTARQFLQDIASRLLEAAGDLSARRATEMVPARRPRQG